MRELVPDLIKALESGQERIICQVVETRGSTPQKAGSLMIIDPEGGQAGTLGGGCVENEVKQKAIAQIGRDHASVHSFVLDHDHAWADGLICGGKMVILTQPARGEVALGYFRVLGQVINEGRGLTEAVSVADNALADLPVGTRFLFDGQGNLRAGWPGDAVPAFDGSRLSRPAERPRPAVQGGVAFLPQWPRIRLVIVGAGHVGQAVASLASQVDFDVWVVDDRHQYANRERFPTAQRLCVGPIEKTLSELELDPQTFALIVTRGHGHDQEALFHLAQSDATYVGLIGSRRKIRLIFDSLRDAGVAGERLNRVTAPVGMDIGSQTVPEIAISIVAELIACRNLGKAQGVARRSETRASDAASADECTMAAVASPS
jgi:xanthine dehydrogenase accessory factor